VPKYMILMNYTDQGIRDVKGTTERIARTVKTLESLGGKTLGVYLSMGQYDLVAIGEVPSAEAGGGFPAQARRCRQREDDDVAGLLARRSQGHPREGVSRSDPLPASIGGGQSWIGRSRPSRS
jgi:hypothetical protein